MGLGDNTALLICHDGDGTFVAMRILSSKRRYMPGTSEVVAKIVKVGNTSRTMTFEARKIIASTRIRESATEQPAPWW